MGRRMRAHDWGASPLGPPEGWPQSLKTIVRVILDSRYAMWMAWGPGLTFFCNDAYLPTVGLKRDWVLGARSDEVWKEIWPDIGPRIEHVLASGQATWDEGLLLFLQRSGFSEETYHTFSYSPVYDDQIRVAGMLCVVTEVTERVIGERRLRVLRDLAAQAVGVESVNDSCQRAIQVLSQYPNDLPFAALYLIGENGIDLKDASPAGVYARRAALSRELPQSWFPAALDLAAGENPWRLGELRGSEPGRNIVELTERGLRISAGLWPDPVQQALVLPMKSAGQDRLVGFLIAGVSPRRAFDEAYGSFLDLIASQVASAIANAKAYEIERGRAEALAEIDRAKTIFFSNVSHEFRTPLTLMLGPVEDMAGDPQLPAAIRSRLGIVHRNSLRLMKLVNSLLEFSRIEAGRIEAAYEPTDLAALTRDLVSTFASAFQLAGLELEQQVEPLSEPVYVDRDMWERVVLNLLSNAFKYTLRGKIEVRLSQTESHAVLSVCDTGIGIPKEAIAKLFDRFYRVEGAQGRTHEGTGIGLALVHELVKLHAGSVSVDSEVGQGTTFTIRLPLGHRHLPKERIEAGRPRLAAASTARAYVQEALRWLPDSQMPPANGGFELSSANDPLSRDSHARELPTARVLVADDNADMRAYLRELLEPVYEVQVAPDGLAALEAARRAPPDLIVSDVMMPRMDGFELLRTLRAEPELRDIPTILLSARAGEESVIEGLEAMADDYLVKPFSARELLARVGAQLQLARLRREASAREQALRIEAEALINEAPLGIYVVGADFRVRDVNPAARVAFRGLPDPIGQDFDAVIHAMRPKEYADEVARAFRHTLQTGETYIRSERIEELSGRGPDAHYEWQVSRIPLADGLHGAVCYFRNVSAHVQARIALEDADRQKNEFLAMLAHELRNPLAPIRNAGEILSRTLPPNSPTHAAIAMVKRQVTQLTRLVDDLLDVSRITQGRVELKREPLDLASVINHAVEMAEPLFRERQHEVSIISSYRALHVNGDMARLVQCVVNILTNAAKYTDAGGKINLQTRAEEGCALVEISDTGAGISPELLPRVFDLFVQGDRSLDRSLGGLGIGLSVARQLIEMHGGRVVALSPGLGRGSTFKLWLPLVERPGELAGDAAQHKQLPRRVLIADDNVDAADSLAAVLDLDGHVTKPVYSARDVLAQTVAFAPDIILLDIGLPEMDGYEVARRIRAVKRLDGVKLVALTGYGQIEDVRRAQEAGFDDHLVKPVDFETLSRCLSGLPGGAFTRRVS
ncbi:MAG: Multi-sensor hybrid histidine kinase [Gammaproteobacteria bacterium]|nr:Multi-sensor hybrid histidine kinase [Gammaproteobacteria bacterium]